MLVTIGSGIVGAGFLCWRSGTRVRRAIEAGSRNRWFLDEHVVSWAVAAMVGGGIVIIGMGFSPDYAVWTRGDLVGGIVAGIVTVLGWMGLTLAIRPSRSVGDAALVSPMMAAERPSEPTR